MTREKLEALLTLLDELEKTTATQTIRRLARALFQKLARERYTVNS
jgi:hypothetical protein